MSSGPLRPSTPPRQPENCVICDSTPSDAIANRRLVLFAGELDFRTEDASPILADLGEVRLPVPPTLDATDVLVTQMRSDRELVFVGVLRGVVVAHGRDQLRFRRYEPFVAPLPATRVGVTLDVPDSPCFLRIFESNALQVFALSGKHERPEGMAIEFASQLANLAESSATLLQQRLTARQGPAPAHHLFHREIKQWLASFLERQGLSAAGYRLDTDGLLREGTARARYTLLGTYQQPSTAVLTPFRCAIDYTVQTDPTTGAEVRQGCLDSLAHVASGCFDAAVRIVLLRPDTPHAADSYLTLEQVNTRNFLNHLQAQHVYVALVGRSRR